MNSALDHVRLCIVSGMPFYSDGHGGWYMTHLCDVLEDIASHLGEVRYAGVRGSVQVDISAMSRIKSPNVRIYAGAPAAQGWVRILLSVPRTIREISVAVRDTDVVFTKLSGYRGIAGYIVARMYRKPVITYLIADPAYVQGETWTWRKLLKSKLREAVWSYVFRKGDVRLYMSRTWADRYLESPRPTDALYVESSLWQVSEVPDKTHKRAGSLPVVLFVGRMNHEKGVDTLLHAVSILMRDGMAVRLVLVGDGPRRTEYMALASELGLNEVAEFRGFIPYGPDLWAQYERADVFVLPSRSEALGLVIIEAMARGLPVVATRVGGIPDLVRDGENGRLVSPDSPGSLAEAIASVLASDDDRRQMGLHNLRKARRFLTSRQTSVLLEAISCAVRNRGRR